MSRKEEHSAIIERCEHVRERMGLNKSQFSARIKMKAQTLNNFLGAQGSKPNVRLIRGVIREFGVNPMWLLFGEGLVFTEGTPLPPTPKTPGIPAGAGELTERVTALEYDMGVVKAFYGNSWPLLEQQAYGKTKANGSAQPEEPRA